ncbi:MAG: hypothetical protein K0M78_03165, partial [Brevundimonas sp.]|nr:hypothetical protein [Brevundimonas sp.]
EGGGCCGVASYVGGRLFLGARSGAGAAAVLARAERQQGRPLDLFVEPGRYLSSDCGWFFARSVGTKPRADRLLVGLDTSVVHLPRMLMHPATASHPWRILGRETAPPADLPVWLCGNSTYSRDFLARGARAPVPDPGEIVVFHHAGAYCRSMFSDFLGKDRPPEIVVDGDAWHAPASRPAAASVPA